MPQKSTRGTNALLAHLVCLVLFCACVSELKAASLYGKVIEVNSGDVFTIFNLNRPVRVKLLGVDAPEMNQRFGDVAKKHLADLVFDKAVLIHYSGISADSTITGRVLLNDADIGAQMIRDGAAWFDPNNGDRLAQMDRDVYQQSEQAARSEHRGLWQQENPTAPWEFVKAEKLRLQPVVSLKTNEPSPRVKRSSASTELTNLTLMMTPSVKGAAPSIDANTEVLEGSELPTGLPFTAFPPHNGRRVVQSMPFGTEVVKVNSYFAAEGENGYAVSWFTAPTYGEDDRTAMEKLILNDMITGAGGAFNGGDPHNRCMPQSDKDVSSNGYWGRELDLSLCPVPIRFRVFTKATGDKREIYLALVAITNNDANVARFLKTFTIGSHKKAQKAP
jgi:endonuclease YncB( thermonuclease family)